LPQDGVACADEHSKQVTGNAKHFEPDPLESTPGSSVEASTTQGAGYPSHYVASPVQSLLVSCVQVPLSDTPSRAQSRFQDPSERYAFPRGPSQRVEHPPSTPGRLLSALVTNDDHYDHHIDGGNPCSTYRLGCVQAACTPVEHGRLSCLWVTQHEELQSFSVPPVHRSSI